MARGRLPSNLGSNLMRGLGVAAIPLYTPTRQENEEGGQILFQNFIREEFENEQLPVDPIETAASFDSSFLAASSSDIEEDVDATAAGSSFRFRARSEYQSAESLGVGTPDGYKNDMWTVIGRDLRTQADDFAKSKQACEVRKKASEVVLSSIRKDDLFKMCLELFREGFSTERVLALFCFCSTLLIRSARENGSALTRFLFEWLLEFIRSKICEWVYDHGGWGKVLGTAYRVIMQVAKLTLICVGIVAGVMYIKKNF